MSNNLAIGFITYGKSTAKYLPYFLSSLEEQTFKDFKVLVFDNTEEADNENARYLKESAGAPQSPRVDCGGTSGAEFLEIMRADQNIGFAAAYNRLIDRAKDLGVQYFLALNPDMVLEPETVEKMVKVLESDNSLGSVCPRILKWDFNNNKKTNIIDSCGIVMRPGLKFFDLGQGMVDNGQFDNEEILGPSGAAAMYRMSALAKVESGGAVFDELMFMYKEDCDLVYRLHLAGYKSKCAADAIIYHDRTACGKGEGDLQVALNRKNKNKQVKKWAFLHQQIIFIKYWKLQNLWNKLAIIWYEIKMIGFALLFERYLLKQLLVALKIRGGIIQNSKIKNQNDNAKCKT